jgi:hypothetical protein
MELYLPSLFHECKDMNFRNLIGAYIAFAKMNKQSHGYRPNKRQHCYFRRAATIELVAAAE